MNQGTSHKQNLHGVQMLRGLAAFAVLVHHTLEMSNAAPLEARFSPEWLTTSGAAGVDIFFVISGFIMVYTCFRADRTMLPLTFLQHRFLRIYPFYWVCCLAFLSLKLVGLVAFYEPTPEHLLEAALLLPTDHALLGVSWTLVYEMYFYLLFSVALLLRSGPATVAATVILLLLMLAVSTVVPEGPEHKFLSNPIVFEFALGMGLGLLFRAGRLPRIPLWTVVPAHLLLFAAPLYVAHESTSGLPGWPRVLAWGLPSLLIVAATLRMPEPCGWLGKQAVLLGDASYATYLTHILFIMAYGKALGANLTGGLNQIYVVPLVVIAATVFGVGAHLYVEKPMTGWIKQARRTRAMKAERN